ncbi:V protein [Tuhoko virus 3]|uniref:V protein n=1 Tax=Tuhoko virus 3 TaxID=798074 RepID=D8WJ38_9MONO|nr:V protein [Tuhoko virus 3]ADI80725.1 V protein [Tuhoko virus 3]
MEPTPSDAEISAWIEKGLATAKHFAPNPVSSQSSLGKSTIKKGNTKVLVSSAEQIASSQPAASHTVKVQAQVHPQQPTASQPCTGARPKTKRTATPAPTPSVQQAVKIEPVYEDIVSNPTHQAENAPLIATQSSAKQSLLCTEPLPSQPSSATRCGEQSFKRGRFSSCSTGKRSNSHPGHRREFDLVWGSGKFEVREWCNPTCSPITPIPRRYQCRCGECPRICKQCEGDYQVLESHGGQNDTN